MASLREEMMIEGSSEELFAEDEHLEQVTLTPREVLDRIEIGWINEKVAPELLSPLAEEKDAMLEQMKLMERNLNRLDRKDMRTELHKLELERIKYVVVSYMRTRLFKIQSMAWHLYDIEVKRARSTQSVLMPEEFKFLKEYIQRTEEYLKGSVTSKFPQPMQKLDGKKFRKKPHLDAFVFLRVLQDATIDVQDSHEQVHSIALRAGEQHVMRYHPISPLVVEGAVHLA